MTNNKFYLFQKVLTPLTYIYHYQLITRTNLETEMGYIDQSLSGDEQVVGTFSVHWFGWVWYLIWSFLIIGIPGLLRLMGTEMGVTSKRVVYKTGIIGRKTNEILLSKIETVEMNQSILGRIFGYGDVKVTGTGISDVKLVFVSDPMRVKNQIEEVR